MKKTEIELIEEVFQEIREHKIYDKYMEKLEQEMNKNLREKIELRNRIEQLEQENNRLRSQIK